jgi:hypothetical protein
MGDNMASCIAKMLQRNKNLTSINLDDNSISANAYKTLATGRSIIINYSRPTFL